MTYLALFRRDYYQKKGSLGLLFFLIISFPVISAIMVAHAFMSVYIVPFTMLPMIIRIFLDSRTAFMAHIVSILLCSICLRTPHEFILLQTITGMASIYSLREPASTLTIVTQRPDCRNNIYHTLFCTRPDTRERYCAA